MPIIIDQFDNTFDSTISPRIPKHGNAWSIAELNLDDAQHRAINTFFCNLSGEKWRSLQLTKRQNANLLLLTVLAHHARQHTQGDRIWSCMKTLPIREGLRDIFFSSNGQPTSELKGRIESAALHWNLRHVFGIPGHHAWFVTLFLQFGFSLPSANKRLPYWLSGQIAPTASNYLLNSAFASQSFRSAWNTMHAYRTNQLSEKKTHDKLMNNPWVLPLWIPQILKLTKSKLHLTDYSSQHLQDEDAAHDPAILAPPLLVWEANAEPVFHCEILATMSFDLEEACYEIRVSGIESIRVVRQESGEYYITGDTYLTIPLADSKIHCCLVVINQESGNREIASQSLDIWDAHNPITLYRKNTGAKMENPESPHRLDDGAYVLFHQIFTIEPSPLRTFSHSNWWLAELPSILASSSLKLVQNGEPVWWPDDVSTPTDTKELYPVKITTINATTDFWNNPLSPPEISFQLNIPATCTLRWIRLGHRVLDFKPGNSTGSHVTDSTLLSPDDLIRPLQIHLGLRADGRLHRLTQRVDSGIGAFLLNKNGQLSLYNSEKSLNTRSSNGFIYHLPQAKRPQNETTPRRFWLLEGNRMLRTVPKRGFPINNLSGYGEPLQLLYGLYNTESLPSTLIKRVRDNGAIRIVEFNTGGFTLQTNTSIELDHQHELIAWTNDHEFIRIPSNHLAPHEDEIDTWFCNLRPWIGNDRRHPSIKAIGFFYAGKRIGTWFDSKFHSSIINIKTGDQAERCAEMLRWFKAPILDTDLLPAMNFLLKKHGGRTISTWLSSAQSPELKLPEIPVDDEWLRVVSNLGLQVPAKGLSLDDANQILISVSPGFSQSNLSKTLSPALAALDGMSPNLIAKIAGLFLTKVRRGNLPGNPIALHKKIMSTFIVTPEDLASFSKMVSLEQAFLQTMLRRAINSPEDISNKDQQNIQLLLNHRLFRRILTMLFLQALSK